MKQVFALGAAVILTFTACSRRSPEGSGGSELITDIEETIAAQTVVNRYLFTSVTPKLRTCWSRLQGEGTVDLALRYARSDKNWVFEKVDTISSTMPVDQMRAAQACMHEAATGTSFTLGERPGGTNFERFVVKWRWLVPLPPEGSQEMARRVGEQEPPKGCAKCITDGGARCVWSETGKQEDCRVDGPTQCSTNGTKCLSGVYGRAGNGIVIF
jgi:hypothetical protein